MCPCKSPEPPALGMCTKTEVADVQNQTKSQQKIAEPELELWEEWEVWGISMLCSEGNPFTLSLCGPGHST